jgi:hypothetical protein
MARKAIYKHATQVDTNTYPDDGSSPVGSNEWNEAPDAEGMLGFSPQTATITISSGALAVTDSVCVASAETGTTDTIDTISITDTSEYDLLYLFADTGDTITLTNTSSPSVSGQIRTVSNSNETLSTTSPTILIRKGNYWYGYGGGVVNALNDIGDVTITSVSEYETLTYNGSNWINNSPDKLYYICKNAGGSTIAKGKFVYISGYDTSNSYIEVSLAANTSASTMPAFGITMEAISAGSTGKVLQQGKMTGLNTDGIAEGTTLYIGTSGDWVTTKPTGTALIQNVGEVLKDNISDGHIHVGGSGRSNDVPNIPDGKIWIGNSSAVATAVTPSGDITISNAGVTAIGSGVIVNDDINASAGIAYSKLASLTDSYVLVGNGSNVATGVAISGDVTLANTGATTVTDLTISSEAQGDILYFNGSNWVRLPAGTSGKVLQTNGAGANPSWETASGGGATIVHTFSNSTNTSYTGTASSFGTVGVGDRDIYIKKIDANNEGVFTKIWKNGSAVEVQIA